MKKIMKRSKLIILIFAIISFNFISCENRTKEINIGDSSSVKILGNHGEVSLIFKEGSMKIDEIEVVDNKNDFQVIYHIDEFGLFKSEVAKNQQNLQPQNYLSFKLEPNKIILNDSLEVEITQQLMTNHIIRNEGNLYYLATYEDGVKVYNSLYLKVIDAVIENPNELKLLLKNSFPFKGNLEFYNYNTKTKLEANKVENNHYSVLYKGIKPEDSVIMLDVEILPSPEDTLLNSTFTQRINIKQ